MKTFKEAWIESIEYFSEEAKQGLYDYYFSKGGERALVNKFGCTEELKEYWEEYKIEGKEDKRFILKLFSNFTKEDITRYGVDCLYKKVLESGEWNFIELDNVVLVGE